jgi:hypothetical protein
MAIKVSLNYATGISSKVRTFDDADSWSFDSGGAPVVTPKLWRIGEPNGRNLVAEFLASSVESVEIV